MKTKMNIIGRTSRAMGDLCTCFRALALLVLVAAAGSWLRADTTWSFAVELSADTDAVTPKITLHWKPDPWEHVYDSNYVPDYTIYRRLLSESSWTQIGY